VRILVHDYAGHPFQFELSRALAHRGHQVVHAYFEGDKGPKGRVSRSADDPDTYDIVPIGIDAPYSKHKFISRWRNDKTYGAATAEVIRRLSPDVIISSNTPLDSQEPIIAACKELGIRFVYWLQDFYSLAIDRLISRQWMGAGSLIARRYRAMERRQLLDSDHIILISEGFAKYLPQALELSSRVSVIPNWAPIGDLRPGAKRNVWSEQWGVDEKFLFLYTGTLGLKHNPSLLVSLADAFADQGDVELIVAASGIGRDRLAATLRRAPRANLRLIPLQPFEAYADVLASADVLVALLESDAGEFSVPSKVQSYLCAGRPILLSAPETNLAAQIVAASGAGALATPDDLPGFIAAAKRLREDAALRAGAARNGRAYAERYFDIERIADRFEAILSEVQDFSRARTRRVRTAR
jgi:glycosyltransferase involved in cell wall biosynthesis